MKVHVGFDLDAAFAKKVIDFVNKGAGESEEPEEKPKKDLKSLMGGSKDEDDEITLPMIHKLAEKKAADDDGIAAIEKLLKKFKAADGMSSLKKTQYKDFYEALKEL